MGEDHQQIMKLQTQSTALQRKTEAETQRFNEMVALARQVEKKIHEQRSDRDRVRSGGVYASKTTTLRATLMNGQLETRRAGLNRKAAQVNLHRFPSFRVLYSPFPLRGELLFIVYYFPPLTRVYPAMPLF